MDEFKSSKIRLSRIFEPTNIRGDRLSVNYKSLTTLDKLPSTASPIKKVHLSYNALTSVDGLEQFQDVTHLYLNNNGIHVIEELQKIPNRAKILVLSLAENPIASHPNFTAIVLSLFPSLIELDGVRVNDQVKQNIADAFYLSEIFLPYFLQNESTIKQLSNSKSVEWKSFVNLKLPDYSLHVEMRPYMLLNIIEVVDAAYSREDVSVHADIANVRTWLYCEIMLKLHNRKDASVQHYIRKVCDYTEDLDREIHVFFELSQSDSQLAFPVFASNQKYLKVLYEIMNEQIRTLQHIESKIPVQKQIQERPVALDKENFEPEVQLKSIKTPDDSYELPNVLTPKEEDVTIAKPPLSPREPLKVLSPNKGTQTGPSTQPETKRAYSPDQTEPPTTIETHLSYSMNPLELPTQPYEQIVNTTNQTEPNSYISDANPIPTQVSAESVNFQCDLFSPADGMVRIGTMFSSNDPATSTRTNLKLTQEIMTENIPEILIDDSMSDFVSPKFAPEWTLSGGNTPKPDFEEQIQRGLYILIPLIGKQKIKLLQHRVSVWRHVTQRHFIVKWSLRRMLRGVMLNHFKALNSVFQKWRLATSNIATNDKSTDMSRILPLDTDKFKTWLSSLKPTIKSRRKTTKRKDRKERKACCSTKRKRTVSISAKRLKKLKKKRQLCDTVLRKIAMSAKQAEVILGNLKS